nr:MAG TPA: hypothetical protein [Caudoviricetes sp.]
MKLIIQLFQEYLYVLQNLIHIRLLNFYHQYLKDEYYYLNQRV